jgi:hypothetical protein
MSRAVHDAALMRWEVNGLGIQLVQANHDTSLTAMVG